MTGPWSYAFELCRPAYPTATGIFHVLRLGYVGQDAYNVSVAGPYNQWAGNHAVRALDGHAVIPGWMAALVLASVVHRDPPAELLAAAAVLIAEGKVEVVR
jgi:hypothetical protein